MTHQLLIVTGQDRPGIVGAVSQLLAKKKINLEDLRMSILEGEFAMMVVVRIPNNKIQAELDRSLAQLKKKWELLIFQCPLGALEALKASQKKLAQGSTWIIRVLGKDKTGIVSAVSQSLAKYHCNITDLQCRILGTGAKSIYTMVLECSIPKKTNLRALKQALTRLAKRISVELQIQHADLIHL